MVFLSKMAGEGEDDGLFFRKQTHTGTIFDLYKINK